MHAGRPRGGGQGGDAADGRTESRIISALGRDARQFDERREVIRLGGQDLVDQLLKFGLAVRTSLAFYFDGEQVESAEIARVQIDGSAQIGDGLG